MGLFLTVGGWAGVFFFSMVSGSVFGKKRLFSYFSPVPEREQIALSVLGYSYYYVNEMLYKSMSENNDNSEIFKLSVLFHLP